MRRHERIAELESSRPHCPNCGTRMWLARIEPDEPSYETRTFECPEAGPREPYCASSARLNAALAALR